MNTQETERKPTHLDIGTWVTWGEYHCGQIRYFSDDYRRVYVNEQGILNRLPTDRVRILHLEEAA